MLGHRDYALDFKPLPETVDEMAELIRTDGFIRFPAQLKPSHCDRLIDRIFSVTPEKRWNDGFPAPGPDQEHMSHLVGTTGEGVHVKGDYHLKNLWNRHVDFLNLVDQNPVIDTVEAVMGSDAHIIGLTGWVTGPGRPDQTLHLDYLPLEIPEDILLEGTVTMPVMIMTAHYCRPPAHHCHAPLLQLTCIRCSDLEDVDEELGPTKFIPNSHMAGRRPRSGEDNFHGVEAKSILARKGDCVMFRSYVVHHKPHSTLNYESERQNETGVTSITASSLLTCH